MNRIFQLAAITSVLASSNVFAQTPAEGEFELGIIVTSGNTETTSLKGKVAYKHELENWSNQYQLEALYKKDDLDIDTDGDNVADTKVSETTAQKYFLSGQGDYKLNDEHSALFVFASYEDDKFSGYDYQSTIAAGYSDQLFGNDTSYFKYNIGPGYSFSKVDSGEKAETAVLRLAAEYQYKFSANAKFTQKLSTEAALESGKNTKTKSESAISANLMGSLSMKAAYTITHNSEVPATKENTDTTTSITFVYLF
ncbi:hypothetical protein DS2_03715 [Catenovulum agarivorans DS-2]|uniref:Salt-induced outer membrane protein n=1 Tax=Catenovulum agarivorans DS-2 TaxID=1328313 RepID=W7R1U6_9ALTE|nr:DUF481 domain-containing protein [Catenovulum agarivorans]EWH11585.1 hypothetical protein DS2_03715 [Catenovulum agarivorans DS-2]